MITDILEQEIDCESYEVEIYGLAKELLNHFAALDEAAQVNWIIKHANYELLILPMEQFNAYFRGMFDRDFLGFFKWLQNHNQDNILDNFDADHHKWICIELEEYDFSSVNELADVAAASCNFFELAEDIATCMTLGFTKERAKEIKAFLASCDPDDVSMVWDVIQDISWNEWH